MDKTKEKCAMHRQYLTSQRDYPPHLVYYPVVYVYKSWITLQINNAQKASPQGTSKTANTQEFDT